MHKISITSKWFSSIWVYRVLYHTEPVGKWFGSVSGYIFLYHTELNKESIANEKKKDMKYKLNKYQSKIIYPVLALTPSKSKVIVFGTILH